MTRRRRSSRARRAREPASRRSTKSLNCTRRDRLSIIVSSGVNKSFVSSQTCIVCLHGLFFVICVTFVKLRTAWVLMCQPAVAAGLAVNLGRSSHVRARALDRSTRARGDWTAFETETSLSRAATPLSPGAAMGSEITASPTPPGLSPPAESSLPIYKTWQGNDVRPPTPRSDHVASTRPRSSLASRATPVRPRPPP